MNSVTTLLSRDATEEIAALIETLHQTEQRLEVLTAGEVDAVSDRDGRTILLREAQEQLRHIEAAKQAAILNALPAHIALLDREGTIISVNSAWRRFAGVNALLSPSHGLGVNYLEICDNTKADNSAGAQAAAAGIRAVLSGTQKSFSIEYSCHSPTQQRWFLMTVTPLEDIHLNGAVVMHVDVSAERQTEENLRVSESRFRQMAANITDVFFLMNPNGTEMYYISPAYEPIWGRACESLYLNPRSWMDSIHPDDRPYVSAQVGDGSGAGFNYEFRIVRPDGGTRWIEVRGSSILDAAGKPYRIAGIGSDVTQRKLAVDELRQSESLKRAILESSLDCIITIDHEGKITEFNAAAEATFGLRRDQALGKVMAELIVPPRLRAAHGRGFAHYLATGQGAIVGKRLELTAIRADGTEFPIELAITAIGGTSTPLFTGFIRDITAKQADQNRLRESEARFRSLTMLSSDWYWEQDEEYRFVALSGVEREGRGDKFVTLGALRWELPRVTPLDVSWQEHKASLDARKPFRNFEYQRTLDDGTIKYISASGEPIFDASGHFTGYRGVASDITDRKRAETRLQESRDRLALATRSAHIGIWEWEVGTKNVVWDTQMYELYGLRDQASSDAFEAWKKALHPEDRDRCNNAFTEVLGGREDFNIEFRVVWPTGEVRDIESHFQAQRADDGSPVGLIGANWDITERKRIETEVRRLNADLERRVEERTAELQAANRELEAFDYSIAHDLMAPIRHIGGFSSILAEEYRDKLDARGRDLLERMQGAGQRMDQLVGDLLALSVVSRREMQRTRVDLSALALLVFAGLRDADPERDIECVVAPGLTAIADLGQIRIVLENLIGNARKFTAQRGDAKIEFGSVATEFGLAFFVRDNGAGFEAAYADKLFTPFQRLHTESEFKGTGIGLATVMRIIARHGGKAWAEGMVNEGATFYFTLSS